MAISTATRDLSAKRRALEEVMAALDLDAVVLSSYEAVSTFAGTYIITQYAVPDRLEIVIVRRDGSATFLACNLETAQVKSQTDIADVREYVEFEETSIAALARVLSELGLDESRLGLESRRLASEDVDTLRRLLPGASLSGVDGELVRIEARKDAWDVAMLEHGGMATLAAVESAVADAAAGTNERAFCAAVCAGMMARGGLPAFLVFATAERSVHTHAEPIDAPLEEGRIWRIDLGARFAGGIFSDLARTGIVGEPTPEQEEIFAGVKASQEAAFRLVEPGRPARELYNAVADASHAHDLPFAMPHVGHGLGLGLHEYPILEPRNDAPLEVGMVLAIEPGIIFPERQEVYHTEDIVLVTESGHRLLTPPQNALLRIAAS
jgi:Xaa-Pro aminopeptidase